MNDVDRDLLVGEALGALSPEEEKHVAELVAKDGGCRERARAAPRDGGRPRGRGRPSAAVR